MKNKEKYAKEIIDKVIAGCDFGFDKYQKKIITCARSQCGTCLFNNIKYQCWAVRWDWANAEYKKTKRFTEHEILFIKALPRVRYVARNKDGTVWVYDRKPERKEEHFSAEHALFSIAYRVFGLTFESVKWEDEEPTSREEILRGSYE